MNQGMEKCGNDVVCGRLQGKRVIILLDWLELGGAEQQALVLARQLRTHYGSHVQIWGLHPPGRVSQICDQEGIPWRYIPMKWQPDNWATRRSLARLTWALWLARPTVLLPYTRTPNVICGLIWRWTGARMCIWNQRDGGMGLNGGVIEQRAVRNTPAFVSNSQHAADALTQKYRLRPGKVRVVRNGVKLGPAQKTREEWRTELGASADCLLACMVANLGCFKDHVTLIRAWKIGSERLREAGQAACLVLAGRECDTAQKLRALVAELGIVREVRFLGSVADISGLLKAVDLGVFNSPLEGCPNGVLECMAAGLPIAATDIPGIREAVGADGYPFLAPPGDAETLASRIVRLALDKDQQERLGAINRQRIDDCFRPEQMSSEMVRVMSGEICS